MASLGLVWESATSVRMVLFAMVDNICRSITISQAYVCLESFVVAGAVNDQGTTGRQENGKSNML